MNSDVLNKHGAQADTVFATTSIPDSNALTKEQAETLIGNCTTTIPMKFDFDSADLRRHTVVIGPTGRGMSALSDTLIEEYKRQGAKPVVVDVGPSYSPTKDADDGK